MGDHRGVTGRAGSIPAGGSGSRMSRDKAILAGRGGSTLDHTGYRVEEAPPETKVS
ncbi:MAG: hypothetical protein ABSG25_02195 [Bryobacteraceae bacterium]